MAEISAQQELTDITRRIARALSAVVTAVARELDEDHAPKMVCVANLIALEIERRRIRAVARELGITDAQCDSYVASLSVTISKRSTGEVLDHG